MTLGFRGLLVVMIVIGMPVASYFLVFRPQNGEIIRNKAEVEHKEALLAKLEEETARNEDLVRANLEVQNSVKMIESRLPSSKDIDALVRQVSDLATQAKLQAPGMRSSRAVPAAQYMEQPIEIEVAGSFIGFRNFIAAVEKLPRITRIHDLKITALTGDKNGHEMKAEFTLSIYFQDEKQVAQGDTK